MSSSEEKMETPVIKGANKPASEENLREELPAPSGWKKFVSKRSSASKRPNVVFVSPKGEEIKTRAQLGQYLRKYPGGPSYSDFDWSIVGDVPRRSSRLSEKQKAMETPESEKRKVRESPDSEPLSKRKKSLSSKREKKDDKTEDTVMPNVEQESEQKSEGVDEEIKTKDVPPEVPMTAEEAKIQEHQTTEIPKEPDEEMRTGDVEAESPPTVAEGPDGVSIHAGMEVEKSEETAIVHELEKLGDSGHVDEKERADLAAEVNMNLDEPMEFIPEPEVKATEVARELKQEGGEVVGSDEKTIPEAEIAAELKQEGGEVAPSVEEIVPEKRELGADDVKDVGEEDMEEAKGYKDEVEFLDQVEKYNENTDAPFVPVIDEKIGEVNARIEEELDKGGIEEHKVEPQSDAAEERNAELQSGTADGAVTGTNDDQKSDCTVVKPESVAKVDTEPKSDYNEAKFDVVSVKEQSTFISSDPDVIQDAVHDEQEKPAVYSGSSEVPMGSAEESDQRHAPNGDSKIGDDTEQKNQEEKKDVNKHGVNCAEIQAASQRLCDEQLESQSKDKVQGNVQDTDSDHREGIESNQSQQMPSISQEDGKRPVEASPVSC